MMMKVYQPVCPDMKFRLAADLSPDAEVSEDSTVSSDSASCMSDDEDVQGTVPAESPANNPHPTHYPINRFPSSPASAPSVPAIGTAEVCQQHQAGAPVTKCLMSELSSASAQPSSGVLVNSNSHVNGAGCVDNCPGWIRHQSQTVSTSITESTPQGACSILHYSRPVQDDEDEDSPANTHVDNFSATESGAACCIPQPVGAYDKIHHSINLRTQDVLQINKNDDCVCDDDDDSDDDNASIEDISISHNVPMCPPSPAPFSPARTPPMTPRKVVVTVDRDVGGISSASSQAQRSEIRSSALYLDVHTNSKCPNPYTLACAITPSPLHEHTTMARTLSSASHTPKADSAGTVPSHTSSSAGADQVMGTQPPRQLPGSCGNQEGPGSPTSAMNRSIYDEIQEALIKEVSGEDLDDPPLTADIDPAQQYPFIHKHMGHLFDKKRLLIGYTSTMPVRLRDVSTSPCRSGYSSVRSRHLSAASTASEAATSVDDNVYMNKIEDGEEEEVIAVSLEDEAEGAASAAVIYTQKRRRKNSDGDGGSRRHSSSTMATPYTDLEVTHRGMHRFIPRHADEVQVGIGDPIHVIKEFDDLWCEGVNLRSGERGIFPAMYANDLTFLEESEDEDEHWKFTMRFLGTVEVTSASGDIALCQAINKVAQQDRIKTASLCILEINQYGIRMIDKSKEGHESHKFSNFFALKNISFCGTHPSNNRYFAFITKHPREARFACHVFHSERSTHRARDALGKAFKRFYQEYMAFTHPTEDIWME